MCKQVEDKAGHMDVIDDNDNGDNNDGIDKKPALLLPAASRHRKGEEIFFKCMLLLPLLQELRKPVAAMSMLKTIAEYKPNIFQKKNLN